MGAEVKVYMINPNAKYLKMETFGIFPLYLNHGTQILPRMGETFPYITGQAHGSAVYSFSHAQT